MRGLAPLRDFRENAGLPLGTLDNGGVLSTLDSERRFIVTNVLQEAHRKREEEGIKVSFGLEYRTIGKPDLEVHSKFPCFKKKERNRKGKTKTAAATAKAGVTSGQDDEVLGPNIKDDHADKVYSKFPASDLRSSDKYIRALRCGAKTPDDFLMEKERKNRYIKMMDSSVSGDNKEESGTVGEASPIISTKHSSVRPMSRVEKMHYDFLLLKRSLQADLDGTLDERRLERRRGFQSQKHIAMAADLILSEMEFMGRASSPNPKARRSMRSQSRSTINEPRSSNRPLSRTRGSITPEPSFASESGPSVWYEASVALEDEQAAKEEADRELLMKSVNKYVEAREGKLTPGEAVVRDVVRRLVEDKAIVDQNLLGAVCQSLTMQQLSDSKALDLLWLVGNQAGVNFEYFKRLLIAIRQKKEVAGAIVSLKMMNSGLGNP